jgi:hypothetical protein
MPRKKLTNTKSVNELAEEYIEAKDRELEAGKIVKSLGPTLKTAMKQSDVEVLETSLGRLVYSKRVSESFNEESLIEYLKSLGKETGIVKTKEYIDYDALESAIYNEKLSQDEVVAMDSYKIVKETEVLTVKH